MKGYSVSSEEIFVSDEEEEEEEEMGRESPFSEIASNMISSHRTFDSLRRWIDIIFRKCGNLMPSMRKKFSFDMRSTSLMLLAIPK